jgi:hypothetical protein
MSTSYKYIYKIYQPGEYLYSKKSKNLSLIPYYAIISNRNAMIYAEIIKNNVQKSSCTRLACLIIILSIEKKGGGGDFFFLI